MTTMAKTTDPAHRVDEPTGTAFVGHEWDGIEELDTPMPRWWLILYWTTIVWGLAFVIAYPALPMLSSATKGMLGWTSRGELATEMQAEQARKAPILAAIAATPIEALPRNAKLMQTAIEGGRAAYKINCVQCHGSGHAGSKGYPNLNDDDWLWGGDIGAIHYTLTHGVRQPDHEPTRLSQMPAYGDILNAAEIGQLVAHVRAISGQDKPDQASVAGAALFTTNCASCHNNDGKGMREFGAPNLTDKIWLYGGDADAIRTTITKSRYGIMPRWNNRLDPVTIKMLAAYVHGLGGGEATPVPKAETNGKS
jgi:cytochrome c oxidase cbb3-type subunit III